ncbi:MAG: hypothetical protein R3F46_09025 [bacterium]
MLICLCGCPPTTGGQQGTNQGGNGNAGKLKLGGTLRLPLEISADDPALASMDFSERRLYALARAIGATLTAPVPGKEEVVLSLATGIEPNDDGSEWSIRLQTGSDPLALPMLLQQHFTGIANGQRNALHAQLLDLLEGAAAVSSGSAISISGISIADDSISFSLTRPYMQFDKWLSQPGLAIADVQIEMDNADPQRVSNVSSGGFGPWKIDRMEQDDSGVTELVLLPNPDSLLGQPVASELRFVLEPDREKQVELFRAGRLDVAGVPGSMLDEVGADEQLKGNLHSHETAVSLLALFDHGQDPWGDQLLQDKIGLRRSLGLSIDRESLEEENHGTLQGWSHFLPRHYIQAIPQELLNNPGYPQTAMLEEARAAQKQSDHEQGSHLPLGMDAAYLDFDDLDGPVRDILQFWSDISIHLQPFPLSEEDMHKRIDLNSHELIVFWNYPAWPDAESCVYPQLYSGLAGNGGNWSRIDNAEIDDSIRQAQATADNRLRNLHLGKLSSIIEERGLFIPAAYASPSLLINPRLHASPGAYDFDASLQGQDFRAIGLEQ